MPTPKVTHPQRAGCKKDGPSPWRQRYKPESIRTSLGHEARPAYPEVEDAPYTAYFGRTEGSLDAILAGNTTWEGRKWRIDADAFDRANELRSRMSNGG
jgi:hypothetical protein